MNKNVSGHQHTFTQVVRMRGSRVRYGCDNCPKIGPWVKVVNPDLKKTHGEVKPDFTTMKVADLREHAKRTGKHGYSKMTRDELIELIGSQ